MKFCNNQLPLTLVIASSIALTACSNDDVALAPAPVAEDVAINFAAQVNGQDFACGQTHTGVGTGGNDYKVTDFRMYVHNARIHDALTGESHAIELTQDGVWQRDNVALLDFEDGTADCATGTAETNKVTGW